MTKAETTLCLAELARSSVAPTATAATLSRV
jgi:hypothetical protein